MSLKSPFTGPEKDAPDLPSEDLSHDTVDNTPASWPTRPTRSTRPLRINDPASRAINDAQEGLTSLLRSHNGSRNGTDSGNGGNSNNGKETKPHIISPSALTRNETHGRVAGPTATPITRPHDTSALAGYLSSRNGSSDSSLSLVVDSYEDSDEVRAVPQTRIGMGVARGKEQLEAIRQRASLLIGPGDGISLSAADTPEIQGSRRAAVRWATRYATHIIIVFIVGIMVAVGSMNGLSQGNSIALQARDDEFGTDQIEGDRASNGQASIDSANFDLTLPRTELSGMGAGNTSQNGAQPGSQVAANVPLINKYTVVKGDTIASVAKAFHVMPETIMGSNGIFDVTQDLNPGDTLNVPPIDGMYYVPQEGDTVESVAQRYGVAPEVISSYAPNNLGGGVKAGQGVVVPGGMMPQREVVLIYTVNPGDTLRDIAARFGVDVPTMINSNDIPDPDSLQIGAELRVLPVAGIEYKVKKGDTLRSIAERTGVAPQTIIDYSPNDLSLDSILQIDQVITVPGGHPERLPEVAVAKKQPTNNEKPATVAGGGSKSASTKKVAPKVEVKATTKTATNTNTTTKSQTVKKSASTVSSTKSNTPKVGTGRMVWPVQGRITQYFGARHNGLDIAISAGTPIHAADAGKVIWSGWRTDGLGYCVMIDHGNGLITVYGHMIRQPSVYVGQYVSKGDIIGNIGSTGRSTGPHVHFMVKVGAVRNYRNPLAYLSSR